MYPEDEFLALSGIQHFAFCRRQWALIHLEQQWSENVLTVQGSLMHARAHDGSIRERRGDTIVVRGLRVHSHELGLAGVCDVVEFHRAEAGFSLAGEEGLWSVVPVEYKRGKAKFHDADRMQLCAQAMCLEEMLCCDVSEGFLYYGKTHSREPVNVTLDLRDAVRDAARGMHDLYARGHTPHSKRRNACRSCSLQDVCLPASFERETVEAYVRRRLRED
ncbi:CRISPR-associated protein Cas4 [Eggerthellaceae bacterium zg-887]|uniref:CRISPR-associated protein Cas4 n=1 Tax=Xiamenia xianingshaonis TaxID=2682776 RepID=UPI00140C6D43|nr:CRISPR-associated protein Cas4 [Xiamenia xianingshaonis]NHM15785.1 CRISPR-associated protein Cas4 [Xiamenia xianingshaonis]